LKNASARIKEIEIELSRKIPASDQIIDLPDASRMTNPELEQREREQRASLAVVRESLNTLHDEIEGLKARPMQLQKESTDAMRRLQEVRKDLRTESAASNETPMVRPTEPYCLPNMRCSRPKSFEQQLLNQEVFGSLLTAERDLANFEVSLREARAQAW
jgi:predicted  nucleic acid-binding Zn-ribbon protein